MNEKKEYLSEEEYLKNKNKLLKIAKLILIIGVPIGIVLILIGIIKLNTAKDLIDKENILKPITQVTTTTSKKTTTKEDKTTSKITTTTIAKRTKEEIEIEINKIKDEISSLQVQLTKALKEGTFSDAYNNIRNEIQLKRSKLSELQNEIMDLEFEDDNKEIIDEFDEETEKMEEEYDEIKDNIIQGFKDIQDKMGMDEEEIQKNATGMLYKLLDIVLGKTNKTVKYISVIPYFLFGGIIILVSLVVALILYLVAKKREIDAFKVQQQMPIEQEKIEKMAPVYGDVAKDIAQGVSEGLKDDENNK